MSSILPPAYSAANERSPSSATSDFGLDLERSGSPLTLVSEPFDPANYIIAEGPHLQSDDDVLLPVLLQCLDATVTGSRIFTNEGKDLDLIIDNTVPTTEQEWEAAIRLQLQRIDYFLSSRTNATRSTKPLEDLLKMKQLNANSNHSRVQIFMNKLSLLPYFFRATSISMHRYDESWDNSALLVHRISIPEKLEFSLSRSIWPHWFSNYGEMPAEFEVYTTLVPSPIVILYLKQCDIEISKELDMDRYTEIALPEVEEAYYERYAALQRLESLRRQLGKMESFKGINIVNELKSAAECLRAFNETEAADELERVISDKSAKVHEAGTEIQNLIKQLSTEFFKDRKQYGAPYVLKAVALLETESGEPATIVETKPDEWQYITQSTRYAIPFETVVSQAGNGDALVFYERRSPEQPSHVASPYVSHTTDLYSMT